MTTATSRTIDWTDSCRSVGSMTTLRIPPPPGGHENDDDHGNVQTTGASSAATGAAAATGMTVVLDVAVVGLVVPRIR